MGGQSRWLNDDLVVLGPNQLVLDNLESARLRSGSETPVDYSGVIRSISE